MSITTESAPAVFAALSWIQGTLLGTVATTVSVIAIAWIGFLMLAGRIDMRRAAQVVFGCFVIFGASTIAAGIQAATSGAASGGQSALQPEQSPPYYPSTAPPAYPQAAPSTYDPYAGAALPPSQ